MKSVLAATADSDAPLVVIDAVQNYGNVRRWSAFYIICLKDPCMCSSMDYCERCLLLMSKR